MSSNTTALKSLAGKTLVAATLALTLCASTQAQSLAGLRAVEAPASGVLLGEIRNAAGKVQMGATVALFDRFGAQVGKAISTDEGRFAFADLVPGNYSVRVTLASFFPALRRNIAVLAGSESLLQVNLSAVLSSIDIVPGAPNKATLMSDEWKWVLRASQSTRPVLRYIPDPTAPDSDLFLSDASGVVRVSAGDSNLWNSSMQQDMGTAFTVETAMSSGTKVRLSGSFGYGAQSGLPSAGFRSAYVRERRGGAPAAVTALTVRQAYFPASSGANTPVMRTATFSSIDSIDILDDLRVDYGFAVDSISLYGRMNYFSPFARATYDLGRGGRVQVAYSSGFAPTDLITRQQQVHTETSDDLAALSQAPRISRRNDRAAVERGTTYEAAYEIVDGKRKYSIMAYREGVRDAVFLMSGDIGMAGAANLLPDLNTRGTVFNAGDYQRTGGSVALTQIVNELLEIAVAGGTAGALVTDDWSGAGPLREHIRMSNRTWATARVNAAVPVTGTRLTASYGWTDFRTLMPVHQSLTGNMQQEVGWNLSCRQPLPGGRGVRMELTAEMRNMLAQGYLRMSTRGETAVLTNAPRQVRGGLSFIF